MDTNINIKEMTETGAIGVVCVKGNPKLEGLLGDPDPAILPLSRPKE